MLHGGVLEAEAIASWIDRRNARALVKLATADGRGLHLLDVRYSVLTPKMFTRLHPPIDPVAAPDQGSVGPDGGTADRLGTEGETVTVGLRGIEVDCGVIPAAACAGHFPDYPAAPVAIVMGQVCRAAGRALAAHLDDDVTYQIEEGHVTATKLARAGQRLTLQASYDRPVSGGHLLHGTALADGEVIGEVEVTMSAVAAADRAVAARVAS